MLWITSWDTEEDAVEFENALHGIASTRSTRTNVQALSTERQGRDVIVGSSGLWPTIATLKRTALRARVTTRAELTAHFLR